MFSTSALYFLVAIFGENIESSETHGLQLVEGQGSENKESIHNESQEESLSEIHNESNETSEELLQESQREQSTNESEHIESKGTEQALHQESASETQRKKLEFPLSVSAGVGYAVIGLWMILDKWNSKIPYMIAIVGSLVLLGIYVASRTVGISSLGIEPVGMLDLIVGTLQGGIIAGSSYVLITKTYTIKE